MISVLTLALAPTFFMMLLGYTAGRVGLAAIMMETYVGSAATSEAYGSKIRAKPRCKR